MEEFLTIIGRLGFLVFAAGLNVFTILWAIRKPWLESVAGKYFWTVTFLLTTVIDLVIVFLFAELPETVEVWLEATLWPALAIAIWKLTYEVIQARRRENSRT